MMSFRTFIEKAQSPNYTFDRWAKSAEKLGIDVDLLVGQAKQKDADLDKEITSKKKEKERDSNKTDKDVENGDIWKKLKKISKEKSKEKEEDQESS